MSGLSSNDIKGLPQEQIIQLVEQGVLGEPQLVTLDLTTAQTNKHFAMAGNYFSVQDATDVTTQIDVGFSRSNATKVPFTKGLAFVIPFSQLFLTWTAQTGKTVTIMVYSFAPEIFQIIDNRSAQSSTATLDNILHELRGDTTAETAGEQLTLNGASQVAIASNTNRVGASLYNPIGNAVVYVRLGGTVTTANSIDILQSGASWSIDNYQGDITVLGTNLEKLHIGEW